MQWETEELPLVLEALERCEAHLTAAIVSKDTVFQNKVGYSSVRTGLCGMKRLAAGTFFYSIISAANAHCDCDCALLLLL